RGRTALTVLGEVRSRGAIGRALTAGSHRPARLSIFGDEGMTTLHSLSLDVPGDHQGAIRLPGSIGLALCARSPRVLAETVQPGSGGRVPRGMVSPSIRRSRKRRWSTRVT